MSLTSREPIRRCGKRYGTEDEAKHSKLALADTHGVVPCAIGCGGFHLERIRAIPSVPARTAPKDTGPSRKVRALVLARDGHSCVCCGLSVIGQQYDLQHRDSRGMGGTSDPMANLPVNLLTALRPHHERMERRGAEDNAKGYWLRMGENPALTGVMYFDQSGGGFTAWLLPDGSLSFEAPRGEAA